MNERANERRDLLRCMLLAAFVVAVVGTASAAPVMNARGPAPSPDGSEIAFSFMGDVWIVPAEGGTARRLTVHEAYDDHPVWAPDGTLIAFTSEREGNGDTYVMPAGGGVPRQLTVHSAWDDLQCWRRDGAGLLFASQRDTTASELYEMSLAGGLPRRVIKDRAFNVAVSPDGRWIAYVRGRTPWWRKHYSGSASRDIWIRAYDGGPSYRLVDWPGDDDRPMWGDDGRTLYFQSERIDGVANIWRVVLDLPAPGQGGEPAVARPPVQVTKHESDGVQYAAISDDGSLIAYEWSGGLWSIDVPDGDSRSVEVLAPSDHKWNDHLRMDLSSGVTEFALSPDETEMALVVRGEVFVASFEDGECGATMRISETPARERDVAWMPDGETLLFSSDREGNYDIYSARSTEEGETELSKALRREVTRLTDSPEDDALPTPSPDGETIAYHSGDRYLWTMEADGGGRRRLVDEADVLHFSWSPDGVWVALSRTTMGHKEDIFIVPAGGGEAVNVTNHPNDDFQPRWSDDGKRLSYASRTDDGQYMLRYMWLTRDDYWKTEEEREEDAEDAEAVDAEGDDEEEDEEEPGVSVEIDFDGLNERTETVMNMRGGYDFYAQTPDGHYFAFPSRTLGGTDLWIVDWKGDKLIQVTEGGGSAERLHWDDDGSTCYYVGSGGSILTVSIDPEDGSITGRGGVGFSVHVTVDVPEERKQMFNEAWRLLLSGFYDPEFHGVDWAGVREHYEPMALAAYTEQEFRMVVREMLGELSASHLGIYRWGGGGVNTGLLGIRHYESHDGPGVRVRAVMPDSPADRAGIEPGDFIVSVNGETIGAGENYHRLLVDRTGEEVLIGVADNARGSNLRDVRIRPVDGGTMRRLAYEDEVKRNRRMVDELSGGRLGYLHIAGMGLSNLIQFEEDLFAQGVGKDGLVIDIRGNGGGSVHDEILRYLDRQVYGYTTSRTRPPSRNPLELYTKPLTLVIDESCYSDAEIFPMGWKALELGPVVGTPTYGAVIGTNDVELIDGTWFRVPGSGWYDLTGRNLENWGIEPDVRVDSVPEEDSRGEDVQLSTAVRVLMESID
ncbi:MAG: S41 family peptidase [Candidatus Eisenbacteria bacterium]